jgi:hypothetical protein
VWQWPTASGTPGTPEGRDEYYTTCSDIDIVPGLQFQIDATNSLQQQDPQGAAVPNYQTRTVYKLNPLDT